MQWLGTVRTNLKAVVHEGGRIAVRARLIFLGVTFAGLTVACVAAVSLAFFSLRSIAAPQAPQSHKTTNAAPSGKTLSDTEMGRMSSAELTRYVYDNHGCSTCHTLDAKWQLGFTERGKQLSKGFEGCASLLTSMNVIAQVQPADRSPDEKAMAARFQEFGCTTCHQIVPGKMALTKYGAKIRSLHLSGCTVDLCCATPRK
jgi:cytochrome c551/c552